jgi:hypothetical protein
MSKSTKLRPALASVPWKIEEVARNVHRISFNHVPALGEQYVLLQSDEHWDNPKCDRELYRKHLLLAQERRAPVIKYGDLFCAMQGKYDPRSSKADLRPEHKGEKYLDSLVETAAEYHEPFADVLAIAGPGNHETSILKRHETHLTERFVEAVRARAPRTPLRCSGFSGWVVFQFQFCSTQKQSFTLWYHHGYGGGGPVTKGVIQTNRRAVYVAEADIIATGHTHDQWIVPIPKLRLSNELRVRQERQVHVCSPGYKDDYEDGFGGWEVERGGPPKPRGGIWLHFTRHNKAVHLEPRLAD